MNKIEYVFETIKYYNNAENLNCHINRLLKAAKFYDLKNIPEKDEIKNKTSEFFNTQNFDSKQHRINIFLFSNGEIEFKSVLYNFNYDKNNRELSIITNPVRKSGETYFKNNVIREFYLSNIQNYPEFIDTILLNEKNAVCECAGSNIFFIRAGILYTPSKKEGLVEGIIRDKIISICTDKKIKIIIDSIYAENLHNFECCFITSSMKHIMPVNKIGEYNFRENSLLKFLQLELAKYIE